MVTLHENEKQVREIIDSLKSKNFGLDSEFLDDFVLEAKEHLEQIELNVLNLETSPDDVEIVNTIFRHFHTIKGLSGFVEQELIQHIAHKTENLLDDCRKGKSKVNKKTIDLILDSVDSIKNNCNDLKIIGDEDFIIHVIKLMDDFERLGNDGYIDSESEEKESKKIGEILVESKSISEEDIQEILRIQKEVSPEMKIGEIAIKEKKVSPQKIVEAIRTQNKEKEKSNDSSYIKIPTYKIDALVDMLGELLITQSLVEQNAMDRLDSNDIILSNLLKTSRITRDIQNLSMSLRMVDLKSTFQKINRVIRSTIQDSDKKINFETHGEDTEIDRNVAEKLLEPLLHLVKNSIAHGIEGEEERINQGKNPEGQVRIHAYSKKGTVFIEVEDDGRGISLEKVYNKALQKNLIEQEREYSEKEIIELILLPGFSTNDKVDNNSGRGVGMDVVKTEVEKIGGRVEIQNNPGKGCAFTLKIPINLAILNGTIIEIRGSKFIIPTLNIKEIVEVKDENWITIKGKKRLIKLRDQIISIVPIEKILNPGLVKKNERNIAIVLEEGNDQKAIIVSSILERRDIIAKPLGEEFKNLSFISGASILGDGKAYLILDVKNLFELEGEWSDAGLRW